MNKLLLILLINIAATYAGPTMVGNGDDGFDLKKFTPITSGPIFNARLKATELLNKVNASQIKGLGILKSEVEKSDLYITKDNLSTKELYELGAFSNDEEGLVYARTFPKAHAATRFFPAAQKLNEKQLISLHIHEALHRTLDQPYNTNEKVISDITLAITSPNATRDEIELIVSQYTDKSQASLPSVNSMTATRSDPKSYAKVNKPSSFSLSYRSFSEGDQKTTSFFSLPIESSYNLSSKLYPFGGKFEALGFGINLSMLKDNEKSYMGPMQLSAEMMSWTIREFDFGFYFKGSFNTLSNEELQNSFLGRDLYSAGIKVRKQTDYFYVENALEYTAPSESSEKIGNVDYNYNFGSMVALKIGAGARVKGLRVGGQLQFLLSDNFETEGGSFSFETGRNRIVTAGPEIAYVTNDLEFSLSGNFLLNSTQNTDLDFLGDIMNQGVGKGQITTQISFFF